MKKVFSSVVFFAVLGFASAQTYICSASAYGHSETALNVSVSACNINSFPVHLQYRYCEHTSCNDITYWDNHDPAHRDTGSIAMTSPTGSFALKNLMTGYQYNVEMTVDNWQTISYVSDSTVATTGISKMPASENIIMRIYITPHMISVNGMNEFIGQSILVSDILGNTIVSRKIIFETETIELPNAPPGIYIVSIGDGHRITKKITVQ